jgi:hypothetical protein
MLDKMPQPAAALAEAMQAAQPQARMAVQTIAGSGGGGGEVAEVMGYMSGGLYGILYI